MRTVVWPADSAGCGSYRLLFPAAALIAQGADVVVDRVGPVIEWSHSWAGRKMPPPSCHVVRVRPYEADVIVLQRPARQHWSEVIPHLQAQGIRVVVDVDDLFDEVDRRHIAHHEYESIVVNHRYVDECCRMADLVTCSTPALVQRYGYGHGVTLPNLVPESYLSLYGLKRPETIGWSGFVGTHPGDLQETAGTVANAVNGTEWSVHIVGGPAGDAARALDLRELPTVTGPVEFAEYPQALAELEIGIVPLEPSKFNEAKSALKACEMAAVGVPVVMSPTPDNLRVNRLGIGLVADSRGQWRRHLAHLTANPDARDELAERGREAMATQTYEQHCGRWADAWTDADRAADRSPALSSL